MFRFIAGDVAGDGDVVFRAERRQQIVFLKHEADGFLAQIGALGVGHFEEIAAVDMNGAGGGRREAAENVEQRRFAGAAGTDDGEKFAARDRETDAAQACTSMSPV